jgi:hypothetical protein
MGLKTLEVFRGGTQLPLLFFTSKPTAANSLANTPLNTLSTLQIA